MLECPLLHNHLAVSPIGIIQPCCRFKVGEHTERFANIKDSSLENGRRSEGFLAAQATFAKNQFPAGCSSCSIEEKAGIKSMRQNAIERSEKTSELASVEFFLGNTCNMKCRSCNPLYSSKWDADGAAFGFPTFEKPKVESSRILNEIASTGLKHLKLLGGEPFFIKGFYDIIDALVVKDVARSLTLEVSSNVSIFPQAHVLQKLKTFKEVQLSLSIDDIGPRAEFLRTGTDWEIVSSNLKTWFDFQKEAPSFDITVHITVSAYNVLHLDSIVLYLRAMGWTEITMMTIKDPTELSPLRIPFQKRSAAWERMLPRLADRVSPRLLKKIQSVVLFPEELPVEEFYRYNEKLDGIRGESVERYWTSAVENQVFWNDATYPNP